MSIITLGETGFFDIEPQFFSAIGMGCSIGISVLGAAWGIFITGSSLVGASVRAPHIRTKNLISVIFAEATAIYGLVLGIIIQQKYTEHKHIAQGIDYYSGYALFWAGIITGFGNMSCGVSVGVVGSSCALADAAHRSLFVKILVIEIFASALGIFAIIVGILVANNASFSKFDY
ncbi:v-type proton atpase 21 kda proteolipid subunit [Anaeramoeba flamelloides]|uniref:V-type proton atpase 21 kDa proteolipid subunit n=1 Tax=Anaeramoeba flamelloides TaxID=1746091 RepID=A0AAV7ZYS9_9EUKA|nr:v-type proton atpase 21 kda proteolipid subunit [Anaeramoeba flamelloides]KAJ3428301.1 v-type proton atpase 21 kda proteolipid subunit [Anaeramoeba flamelloides]KAJ3434563.1 v-type proton atpase 21 kda proteolipid subunit [Anaeramoeba flamelloides]KAJ3435636.1 v-type proton atpase 21 kda proteolipid subunit [Anaeramoeba flamelloides]KAJ3438153.1 v-type proton atpase 21 kda proteolipid subunit [Anaeramoeba flamelloides]